MADVDIDSLLEAGVTAKANGSNEGESNPAKDKGEKESSSRKDRDRDSRSRRSRTRSKDRKRDRRSRSRDRRRKSRSRSRSRDRSRRRRSRSNERRRRRSRSRDRSRDRKRRSKSREKSKSRSASPEKKRREPSTSAERALKEKEKELAELTRDHRTVFVSQLQVKVKERQIKSFFEQIGPVVKVNLIKDKYTNRSKGFAYVEMQNLEDIPKVLLVNGLVPDFQVFPLAVKASEAEKNYAAKLENSNTSGASKKAESVAAARVYVGNLHMNVTEDILRDIFANFGEIMSVHINRDETGRSKGYAFIQFARVQEAQEAMQKAQSIELFGNNIKIGPVNEGGGSGGAGSATSGLVNSTWKLDDDDGAGLQMNAHSRTALMVKLAGGAGKELAQTAPGVVPGLAPGSAPSAQPATPQIQGLPSKYIVIVNMFDPASETDPDWDQDIKEETVAEVSKYGKVAHCHVEKDQPGGLVFLMFEEQDSAETCARALNGRWFAGRQITIRFLSSAEYGAKFPQVIFR